MMTENKKKMQMALGTMKKQMFVGADWKDIDGLIDDFRIAFKNFGLFMYPNPGYESSDAYGYVISNEELDDKQISKLCACEYIDNPDCADCPHEETDCVGICLLKPEKRSK